MVQLADADRTSPETLREIYVRAPNGAMVQLGNVVRIEETVAPRELTRFQPAPLGDARGEPRPGYTMGEAVAALNRLATRCCRHLPDRLCGQSREFLASGQSLVFVFLLAIVFIYLVLAAQFESFVDPIVILVTVPLSMTGALAALSLTGGTLNVYSQIGLITLVGLITKHAS